MAPRHQLTSMLGDADELRIEKVATPYDIEYASGLARLSAAQLGFFTVACGRKRG